MKKIMIMLSAVAMAACVQAAQVAWSMTVASQGATWNEASAYVMAFDGANYNDASISLLLQEVRTWPLTSLSMRLI